MRTWPGALPPAPAPDSWTETTQPNVSAFQPDVGAPIKRRRTTASGATCTANFTMTDDQAEIFAEFFDIDLADGTLPFVWAHPKRLISFYWTFDEPPQIQSISKNANRISVKMTRLP